MLSTALQSRAHIGDISVVPRRANRLQLPWPPRAGPTSFTSRTSHTSHLCAELTPGAVVLLLLGTLTRQHGEQTLQGTPSIVPLRAILQKLFAVVPAPNGSVWDPSHCRTCAVVGNSGRLKGSRHGLQIDAHHWVLRMNRAKTAGFEMDVGARTTHHFMYPESAMNLWPGVHLVLVPFKPLDLKWVTSAFSTGELTHTYTRVKQFIKADRNKVLILSPAFLKYIHENWTERHGRSPCLASVPTAKGTGITTGKKTAGLERSAGQGSTMLMSSSASSKDWQLKAEYYSINDTHSRNEAKPLAQEAAAAAAL
eukprot:XP_024998065.1 uncharacterized protein ST3GAL2L isoform X3 [Gallus gallus]